MTVGHDHTCRVFKIPEESQLIFRSHASAVDCVKYITATQVIFLTGEAQGFLQYKASSGRMHQQLRHILLHLHRRTPASISYHKRHSWPSATEGIVLVPSAEGSGMGQVYSVDSLQGRDASACSKGSRRFLLVIPGDSKPG